MNTQSELLEEQILDGHMAEAVAYLSSLMTLDKHAGRVLLKGLSDEVKRRLLISAEVSQRMKEALIESSNVYKTGTGDDQRQLRRLWKRVFPHYANWHAHTTSSEAGESFHVFLDYVQANFEKAKDTRWAIRLLVYSKAPQYFKLGVVEHPQTKDVILGILAQDVDPVVRLRVAQVADSNSSHHLATLAQDSIADVRLAAVSNPHTSSRALVSAAGDPDVRVRLAIASHTNASLATLKRLLKDTDFQEVREQAQSNLEARNTAPSAKRKRRANLTNSGGTLITSQDELGSELNYQQLGVLWNIAGKPSDAESLVPMLNAATPQAEKRFLTKARVEIIETLLSGETALSDRTYAILVADRRVTVRRVVAKYSKTPSEVLSQLAAEDDKEVRIAVARNLNTPIDILSSLATEWNRDVHASIGGNPNTPIEVLTQLASHEDRGVRSKVADNPNTPSEILTHFASDEDWVVREGVARNPNTPSEVRTQLVSDEAFWVREGVARNPNTPSEVLTQLAADEVFWVRRGVALNSNTSTETLKALVEDENGQVKEEAHKTLTKRNTSPGSTD